MGVRRPAAHRNFVTHRLLGAFGVMEVLVAHGLAVPDDVASPGRDSIEMATSPLIGMTSIKQHAEELGRTAAGVMPKWLAGESVPASTRGLEPTLVVPAT